MFPNLTTLNLTCFSHSKHTQPYQYDNKPFHIPDEGEVSILRSGPLVDLIMGFRFANWSDDRTLLNKLLSLYHTSLRTLSLRGRGSVPQFFNRLTTTPRSVKAANSLHRST
jgi:hypothetical protein